LTPFAATFAVSKSRQLIACPACESPLIQVDCNQPSGESETVLERHCPECGHEDELVVATVVAEVLAEHASELATSLEELADCLESAAELWISQ
jgi:peptide subunit release factor 1 (eRF1)